MATFEVYIKKTKQKKLYTKSERLSRSFEQNLAIFAGVLMGSLDGPSLGVRPVDHVIEERYRKGAGRLR